MTFKTKILGGGDRLPKSESFVAKFEVFSVKFEGFGVFPPSPGGVAAFSPQTLIFRVPPVAELPPAQTGGGVAPQ